MTTASHAPRRSAEEQATLDAALADLFQRRISFNQVLGLEVLSACAPEPRIRLLMRPELVGHYLYGRLHGGVISATLDAMGGLALMVATGEKHADETTQQVVHRFARMSTIDLRVDFLNPGIGTSFTATALVTRLGGRIGSTQMRLHSDQGTLVATAGAAYVLA